MMVSKKVFRRCCVLTICVFQTNQLATILKQLVKFRMKNYATLSFHLMREPAVMQGNQ